MRIPSTGVARTNQPTKNHKHPSHHQAPSTGPQTVHPLRHPTGSTLETHPEHSHPANRPLPGAGSASTGTDPRAPRSPRRQREPSGLVQTQDTGRRGPREVPPTPWPPALHKHSFSPPLLQHGAWGAAVSVQTWSTSGEHFRMLHALSTQQPREGPAWPPSGSDNDDGPHHQSPATSQGCHLQRPHPRLLTKHLSPIPAPLFISLLIGWKAKLHNRECDPCLGFGGLFFFFLVEKLSHKRYE